MPDERVHISVRGRVQGVCFRRYTFEKARQLELTGWVRNNPDGSVEIVAEGNPQSLVALADLCRHGPPAARVSHITVGYQPASGVFDSFRIV